VGHGKRPKGIIEESMYDMLKAIQHICGVVPGYQLVEAMTTTIAGPVYTYEINIFRLGSNWYQ